MTTRLATAKRISQQKVKEKPVDATVPDSSIPVHKGTSVMDDIMSWEQAGECGGKPTNSQSNKRGKSSRIHRIHTAS